MYEPLIGAFDTFQAEGLLVGKILAGYAQLEVDLLHCIATARQDFNTTVKALFRTRGETQRLEIADALARARYHDLDLGTEFEMAIGAMRYCLKIRNQYAHCGWYDDLSGRLAFVNLETLAHRNEIIEDLTHLEVRHVTVALLEQQHEFLNYASRQLVWVNFQGGIAAGSNASHDLVKPKQIERPPLHIA